MSGLSSPKGGIHNTGRKTKGATCPVAKHAAPQSLFSSADAFAASCALVWLLNVVFLSDLILYYVL